MRQYGVLGEWKRYFLKPGPRLDKPENDSLAFSCMVNLYIFWNDDVISPRLDPSQTPLRHVTIVFLSTNINTD